MIRNKKQLPETTEDTNYTVVYDSNNDPISISPFLINLLLSQENPCFTFTLFWFYYKTGKWQKTSQPKANDKYCMSCLKMGKTHFYKAKKTLIDLNLIEQIQEKNEDGLFKSIYIRIKPIWGDNQLKKTNDNHMEKSDNHEKNDDNQKKGGDYHEKNDDNHMKKNDNPTDRANFIRRPVHGRAVPRESGFWETNALILKINAYRKKENTYCSTQNLKERNSQFFPIAKKLHEIITSKKNIKYDQSQIMKWANDIRILHEKNEISIERIIAALNWYADNIGGDYVPVVESGISLRTKFLNLEAAVERNTPNKQTKTQGKPIIQTKSKNIHNGNY